MKCRKNVRKLIEEFNAASPANKPLTPLMRFRNAIVALKAAPSQLGAPHTQANRYDDYVYIHQQSMAGHDGSDPGPHPGHRGPMFFTWHRAYLRHFENDLRSVSGDMSICLPYWDWSRDQSPADAGYPFTDDFLGGNGIGPNNLVQTGVFAEVNGWNLAINDDASTGLQRDFAAGAPSLPSTAAVKGSLDVDVYDVAPWNRMSGANSFRNLVEGWSGPQAGPNTHNRVHVWVGGSMLPSTSPNDPVFFLNHAKEDELWAVWVQKYPSVAHYLPLDSEPLPAGHTHLKRLSDHMEDLAEYFGGGTTDRPIDLIDHKAITWYDTDLPEITLESGPAVGFNNIPELLTASRNIRFRVKTCRRVFFTITGAPSGNFSIVGGINFPVVPAEANDFEILEIQVQFHAVGPNVQVSAVDIEAHIIDEEGYYANNANDPFVVEKFHIQLVANNIVTSDSSVALVLDRSFSMTDVSNGGFTKNELLKSAVGVLHTRMKDNDQIGIARFDHESDVLLPMTLKSAGLGTVLTGNGLDPRGNTSIGAGILTGSGLINGPGATYPNKAMIVLTDGNENTNPLISALPPGTINQTTFAVGFGLPGQVSDPILSQISANSGGYLLVTGTMTNASEQFQLAKFFVQILKDATLNQTVMDPQGLLLWNGLPLEIPFQISDTEVSIDISVLCPIPIALDFQLVTPGGHKIDSSFSGAAPNVQYVTGQDVVYYRIMLPALPDNPGGSQRGIWKAVLSLKNLDKIWSDLRYNRENIPYLKSLMVKIREFTAKPVPFNLMVHSYSNLVLDATLTQSSFAPGTIVYLTANLWEYQVPLKNLATIWADVLEPDGSVAMVPFSASANGGYVAEWITRRPGIYRFTIRAEGRTTAQARFTREKILTAGVWSGGDKPYNPQVSTEDEGCSWMKCLLEQINKSEVLQEQLKRLGINLNALEKCISSHCQKRDPNMQERDLRSNSSDEWKRISELPEFRSMVDKLTSSGTENAPFASLQAAQSTPVKRKAKLPGRKGNMFIVPEEDDRLDE